MSWQHRGHDAIKTRVAAVGLREAELHELAAIVGELRPAVSVPDYLGQFHASETDLLVVRNLGISGQRLGFPQAHMVSVGVQTLTPSDVPNFGWHGVPGTARELSLT